ncbi:MAG: hypothetical protein WA957_12720 [Alteraurantiacibacter sp.]
MLPFDEISARIGGCSFIALRYGVQMAALGCFLLLILPLAGLLLGGWLAGTDGMIWGAGAGFAVALAITGMMTYALVKARRS